MAKKKSNKGKGSYASYVANGSLEKNSKVKRARHAKRHPNDEQSVKQAKPRVAKQKARTKGNYPAPKTKLRDAAGNLVPWPEFKPKHMLGK